MKATSLAVPIIAVVLLSTQFTCAQSRPDILWKTNAHNRGVTAVAVSFDGTILASGSRSDGLNGYIRVWQVTNATVVRTTELSHEDICALAFSPDGNYLASGGGGGTDSYDAKIRLWSVPDGTLLHPPIGGNGCANSVAFSRQSTELTYMTGEGDYFQLLHVPDFAWLGSGDEPPGGGSCVTFSPTAKLIVTGGGDGSVTFWSYTNRLSTETILVTYAGQSDSVTEVAFLPDGSRLVSSSGDGTVVIRRISDGVIERTLHDSAGVGSVVVSPDGKTLLTRSSNIKFWRVSDGALLQVYDQETQGVTSLAISPTGKFFAYGRYDGTVVVARMPLWIEEVTRNGNEVTLRWQGGSGLYQLQARNDLGTSDWQNVGNPTTNNVVTHSCLSPIFFRIQSLPNP